MLQQIGQIAVFLICAQTLLHFRAKDSYEKYIKLLVSMMLLMLLISPVLEFLRVDSSEILTDRILIYEEKLQNLLTGTLQEASIETILRDITQNYVEEGVASIEAQGIGEEVIDTTEVNGRTVVKENNVDVMAGAGRGKTVGTVTENDIETSTKQKIEIRIEPIEIGGSYGKSTENT